MVKMELEKKKVRITITVDEEVSEKISKAAKRLGIPTTAYVVLSTLEKVNREEKE